LDLTGGIVTEKRAGRVTRKSKLEEDEGGDCLDERNEEV